MSDETKKLFTANLNTILMGVLLAAMSWMAAEVRSTALALAELRATTTVTAQNASDSMARMEVAVGSSVSRREYDSKLAAVETRLAEIGVKLRELDVALVKLQTGRR